MAKYILLSLLCICITQAQTSNETKLNDLFNNIEANHQGMGGISIFSNGKEVYQKSFGFSDVSKNTLANSLTKYRIGSVTKTFTATIIMQLIEENKLMLSTLLSDYFPKIPNAEKITIEDLLRHQSGLFNITESKDISSWITKKQTRQQMINRIISNGTNFKPKETTEYSNTNFIVLAYVAEEVENESFQNILNKRIIHPIGLKRTEFGKPIDPTNNEALAYYRENSNWVLIDRQTHMSTPMGAGAIVSTPTELNIFLNHLFNHKLISSASLSKMKKVENGIGMGLMKPPLKDIEVFGHGGSIDGFNSFAAYFPDKNVSVAFTANNFHVPPAQTLMQVMSIYFGIE